MPDPSESEPSEPKAPKSAPGVRRWLRRGLVAVVGVVVVASAVVLALAWRGMGAAPEGARLKRMAAASLYVDGRFANTLPEHMAFGWSTMRRFLVGNASATPAEPPPVHERKTEDFPAPRTGLAVTWLGHSSLLIEIDGAIVLTDPVFSERTSPVSFLGPTRFHRPPIAIDQLPKVDAVVISHDHYDHLDTQTIIALSKRVGHFVVPLGVGAHLQYWGVPPGAITELDWWQEFEVGSLRLVCTPARHFSGRGFTDRNRTLWSSWALIGASHRMYFSGDTAMFPGFAEIGKRLGPFDVAALEVGAYDQAWPDVHLGPEQAVAAHQAVGGRLMLPVHWGTFDLALHPWTEPATRTRLAAQAAGVTLLTPEPGQRIDASAPPPPHAWWPSQAYRTAAQYPVRSTGL